MSTEKRSDNPDDKSVLGAMFRALNRSLKRDAQAAANRDVEAISQVAGDAMDKLNSGETLSPMERTEALEVLHDFYRLSASDRLSRLIETNTWRNIEKKIPFEEIMTSGPAVNAIRKERIAAVIDLVFCKWEDDGHGPFKKTFSSEKRAKAVRRILQEIYMCASWDVDSLKDAKTIEVYPKGKSFEVSVPENIMQTIDEHEADYLFPKDRDTQDRGKEF